MNKVSNKNNPLNIFLLKKEFSNPDFFLKNPNSKRKIIKDVGTLYYEEILAISPNWSKKFFLEDFFGGVNRSIKLVKAIFVIKIEDRFFAIIFSYGKSLLNVDAYEKKFGLKVAFDIIDMNKFQKTEKMSLGFTPKLSKEQLIKNSSFDKFNFNKELDILKKISAKTLKTNDDLFGKNISAGDSLKLSTNINVSNIKALLEKCLKIYKSESYKKAADWIDNFSEIKEKNIISELNEKLINKIKNKDYDGIWMAVPEMINYSDLSNFELKLNQQNKPNFEFGNDISISKYFNFFDDNQIAKFSLRTLRKHEVTYISSATGVSEMSWSVFQCLYCEIKEENKMKIFHDNAWYEIDNDFSENINNKFESIKIKSHKFIKLPNFIEGEDENDYNIRASSIIKNSCNMDKKLIHYGGLNQKFEFCDIFYYDKKTEEKVFIHVKKRGYSQKISHLFNQGLVSGEHFLDDEVFLKINKKLPKKFQIENKNKNKNNEILFALISGKKNDLNIPFFSKIILKQTANTLTKFGYKVSLIKIETEILQ